MTDNNQTYKGHITRYDSDRHFGFIETPEGNSYFFFFDMTEQIQLKKRRLIDRIHMLCSGDEVEFNLRPSKKSIDKPEAYNLKFIKNERREQLINEAHQSDKLLGYIKLIDNEKLFVKHISTYVFLPLLISSWETKLDEVYYNRVEQLVTFRLTQTQKTDRLRAVLTDKKYIDEFYELQLAKKNEAILTANIAGRNSDGLIATILEGRIKGFVPISKNPDNNNLLKSEKIRIGSIVPVRIKQILKNKRVSLALADNE